MVQEDHQFLGKSLASVVWKELKSTFFDFDFGFVKNLGIVNELGACVREGLH